MIFSWFARPEKREAAVELVLVHVDLLAGQVRAEPQKEHVRAWKEGVYRHIRTQKCHRFSSFEAIKITAPKISPPFNFLLVTFYSTTDGFAVKLTFP